MTEHNVPLQGRDGNGSFTGLPVAINFYGTTLIALEGDSPATTMVAMKPVAEGMGLKWERQREKLNSHPVLAPTIRGVPFPSAGGPQETACLPLSRLNFWLATIQPNKIPDPETRARVIRYQEECADVLFAHFFAKTSSAQAATPEPTLPLTPDEVRSYVSLVNAGRRIYGNRAAHFLWKQTPLPQIPGDLMDNSVRSMTADEVTQLCWGIEDFYGAYGVLKSAGITHREAQTWARWHVQRTLERRVERMAAFRLTSENDELF